ncbi:MAG TPA: hypothetical protein VEY96_08630 [Actinomycetes bacterium]|nr:hypothetical protein [Actinomycetes bacterium]
MTDHDAQAGGHGGHHGNGSDDTTGVHGMLLFGEDVTYLSHLPMFMSPHHFQVILEVEFDDAVRELLNADLHTFEPEVFAITELDPSGGGPARTRIEGTVFRGHFERQGTPIAERVTAEVRGVVYFAELDREGRRPAGQALTYLCFGRAGQLHLAHQITARPDFDQVLQARLVPGSLTDPAGRPVAEEGERGFELAAPVELRGRGDTPEERLAPGDIADGFFVRSIGPTGSHGFAGQLVVGSELYLELDELGS